MIVDIKTGQGLKIGYLGAEQYALLLAEAEQKLSFEQNIKECLLGRSPIAGQALHSARVRTTCRHDNTYLQL